MLVEHEKLPAFAEKTIDLVLLYMVKPDLWRTQQKGSKKAEEDEFIAMLDKMGKSGLNNNNKVW